LAAVLLLRAFARQPLVVLALARHQVGLARAAIDLETVARHALGVEAYRPAVEQVAPLVAHVLALPVTPILAQAGARHQRRRRGAALSARYGKLRAIRTR